MSESAHPSSVTQSWRPKGGAMLFDRYQVLGVIGQGGMGTVYKGYHLSLKRFVAIKVLRIDQVATRDLANRFLREMEAVGRMDHPNVVRAADAGKLNGVFYLVMEYLDGADLSHLVAARGRLEPADACELARQAAVGLEYIHQTLIHRDIKPSNLILTASGLVKILDLGLARLQEVEPGGEYTPTGSALGTYDYLAPEQAIASSRVDGRADVYSLGCTLFKLLTGQPPFSGPEYEAPARKLFAHANTPLTTVAGFASVPEALRPVLLRMTAKDAEERYASAREAAEALAPFAVGSQPLRLLQTAGGAVAPALRPLPARMPQEMALLTVSPHDTPLHIRGLPEFRTAPPSPRRRWMLFGGASALACAAAAAAGFLFFGPRELPRTASPQPPAIVPSSDEVRLPPPPGPLLGLDKLSQLRMHNLLGLDEPPTLVGYRLGDGTSSGRWMPNRQQVEINPTETVLTLLAADERKAPGFTFEVLMDQHPWSGGVGLFWGYQEDADAKAAHDPGRAFARCQMLLLVRGHDADGGVQFYVERAAVRVEYDVDGALDLTRIGCSRDNLPNFTGEQLVQIVVAGGQLKTARWGDADLAIAHHAGANREFLPADYRGAFGVITLSANLTFRQPRVMPHADD